MGSLSRNVGITILSPLGMGETEQDGEYPGIYMCVYFNMNVMSVHNIDASPCIMY